MIMGRAALPRAAYDDVVNEEHLRLCSSPEWARLVEDELLPWVLAGHELGDDLLEACRSRRGASRRSPA
jgi:hypothetical protein